MGVCIQQADVIDIDGRVSVAKCYLKLVLAVLKSFVVLWIWKYND